MKFLADPPPLVAYDISIKQKTTVREKIEKDHNSTLTLNGRQCDRVAC
jgi:hypothetical protein